MGLRIREERLPGIGRRYDLVLDGARRLVVVVQHAGGREISIVDGASDEPDFVLSLTDDQAVAVAALLTGARFSIDKTDDDRTDADEIAVDTVALEQGSPAVGRRPEDVPLPDACDAAVLAVIRDEPREVVEDEPREPCRAGDRLVVAARRDRLPEIARALN